MKISTLWLQKAQYACEKNDVYTFINYAMRIYVDNGLVMPEEYISLIDDETDENEKKKIMHTELIKFINEC